MYIVDESWVQILKVEAFYLLSYTESQLRRQQSWSSGSRKYISNTEKRKKNMFNIPRSHKYITDV